MVVPFAVEDISAFEPHQVEPCARCGRRFPYPDTAAPGAPFCEPCRAAMWAADRQAHAETAQPADGSGGLGTRLAQPEQRVLPARQCGRCRELFDCDPSPHARAIADWWLCEGCRAALYGPSR